MRQYLPILLLCLCACEDDYHYPSVQLEYVTVASNEQGAAQTIIPDKGGSLDVSFDKTGSTLTPSSYTRVLSYYEVPSSDTSTAIIYTMQSLLTPTPVALEDFTVNNEFRCDPIEVFTIWLGRDYLNMRLTMDTADKSLTHVFAVCIIDESYDTDTSGETIKSVTLSLYHDADGDTGVYSRTAYMSIPLYTLLDLDNPDQPINVGFVYSNEDGTQYTYSTNGFTYTPSDYALLYYYN